MASKQEYLRQVLAGEETLLFDGGFGTMLQQRCLSVPGKATDDLCMTAPEEITAIHRLYVRAGACVATTNTFNTNARSLEAANSPYSVEDLYAAAARCARDSEALFVAGDMGPLGEFLEPYGNLDEGEAYELFARNACAIENANCDFALVETMMDVHEACLAVRAVRENTALPVMVTLSFNERGRTLFGNSPDQAVDELVAAGVAAVGMNCSVGPAEALSIVQAYAKALREAADGNGFAVPLIVQPNAGLPDTSTGQAVYRCTPQDFSIAISALMDAGATIIGGCCGTTPDHIAAVHAMMESRAQGAGA